MDSLILHLNNMVQTLKLLLPERARAPIVLEKNTEGPRQSAGSEGRGSPLPPSPSCQRLTALVWRDLPFTAKAAFLSSPQGPFWRPVSSGHTVWFSRLTRYLASGLLVAPSSL